MAWRQIGEKPLSEAMLIEFTDAYIMRHLGERVNILQMQNSAKSSEVKLAKDTHILPLYWQVSYGVYFTSIYKKNYHVITQLDHVICNCRLEKNKYQFHHLFDFCAWTLMCGWKLGN